MKIFIACSKHFYNQIEPIKYLLEEQGHKIALPNSYEDPFAEDKIKEISLQKHSEWKASMMKKHEKSIGSNDAILVLNFEKKGIPNYIGGATFMEIVKAWELGKKIYFYNPIPNCSFTDELDGINPTIINGDLSKIK